MHKWVRSEHLCRELELFRVLGISEQWARLWTQSGHETGRHPRYQAQSSSDRNNTHKSSNNSQCSVSYEVIRITQHYFNIKILVINHWQHLPDNTDTDNTRTNEIIRHLDPVEFLTRWKWFDFPFRKIFYFKVCFNDNVTFGTSWYSPIYFRS